MREFSSFRDPSGAVMVQDGVVVRQVNRCYQAQYDALMDRLYEPLTARGLLVEHAALDQPPEDENACLLIRPTRIPFISYPYDCRSASSRTPR